MRNQIRQACARMAEVRESVSQATTPEEINACVPIVERVVASLQSAETWLSQPELVSDMEQLRFELGIVETLTSGAFEFYRGWARILAPDAASYTPTGQAPEFAAPASLSVIG